MREGEGGNLETMLVEIRAQLADLGERVSRLEEQRHVGQALPAATVAVVGQALAPAKHVISEDRLVAISAAVAAFLGERVRIRQIRLIRSNAWAQQGRVSVQASHWLHR